mmetsp:Transcript_34565/g.71361  ORF Transcript_34565/g.71361 Transcript_34565/m.71361 type:complete len:207 (+) Transcript_34565:201-821(+)
MVSRCCDMSCSTFSNSAWFKCSVDRPTSASVLIRRPVSGGCIPTSSFSGIAPPSASPNASASSFCISISFLSASSCTVRSYSRLKLEPMTVMGSARIRIPLSIVAVATTFPSVVSGKTSPYPTVVIVTTHHHAVATMLSNWLLSTHASPLASSATYQPSPQQHLRGNLYLSSAHSSHFSSPTPSVRCGRAMSFARHRPSCTASSVQ